jgi:hypothetical protein
VGKWIPLHSQWNNFKTTNVCNILSDQVVQCKDKMKINNFVKKHWSPGMLTAYLHTGSTYVCTVSSKCTTSILLTFFWLPTVRSTLSKELYRVTEIQTIPIVAFQALRTALHALQTPTEANVVVGFFRTNEARVTRESFFCSIFGRKKFRFAVSQLRPSTEARSERLVRLYPSLRSNAPSPVTKWTTCASMTRLRRAVF